MIEIQLLYVNDELKNLRRQTFVKSIQPDAKLSSDWLSGRKYVPPLLLISRYRPQSLNILTNSLSSRLKTQSPESLTVAKQSFLGEKLAFRPL